MDINVTQLSKSFDGRPVLQDISLHLNAGEIMCLLGPSGSGKTTLIRLILGAIPGDKGEIRIGEYRVPDLKLLRHIGFMPQNEALYDDLSALDNLRFFGGLYHMEGKVLESRMKEALALVDLQDHKNKLVRYYSGGMKKRLSLAVTLLHDPDVFLLDEPTVGIDPVLRRNIWKQFSALKARGKTLIVSTHAMDEVVECDRAALIHSGRLLDYDTVPNLLAKTPDGRIETLFFQAQEQKGGISQ